MLWNRDKLDNFTPEWGLRQGYPVSPYFFILCMKVLGHAINEVVQVGKWKAVKASRNAPKVSHLFFADDVILFDEACVEQAKIMERVLHDFCMMIE